MSHLDRGKWAEQIACQTLVDAGYRIVMQNYSTPRFEIDIIAWDGPHLVFVEVRGRRAGAIAHPLETITEAKRRRLLHGALHYMQQHKLTQQSARFDFVAVLWQGDCFSAQIFRNVFTF